MRTRSVPTSIFRSLWLCQAITRIESSGAMAKSVGWLSLTRWPSAPSVLFSEASPVPSPGKIGSCQPITVATVWSGSTLRTRWLFQSMNQGVPSGAKIMSIDQ